MKSLAFSKYIAVTNNKKISDSSALNQYTRVKNVAKGEDEIKKY
jgi:hypothetical protein